MADLHPNTPPADSASTRRPGEEVLARLRPALAERYRIESEIGYGGMATVYRARDLKHDRFVAIKVLRPELATSLGAERFLHEIHTAAQLVHPHILAMHDSGEADGLLYYVMPYVAGESLRERLSREGKLPLEDALCLAREVADALVYAHSRGVVHRDIKPENILLLNSMHAAVADFGLARALFSVSNRRLTATGLVVGSPLYMSPEQITGEEWIDGRADVYSLGCVLWEMLAGQPPFEGPSIQSIITQHLTTPRSSLRLPRPDVPESVEAALVRAMAQDPGERLDAAGLMEMLAAATRRPRVGSSERSGQRPSGHAVPARQVASAPPRVLVLPFTELAAEPGSDFIAIGLTDEIITNLSDLDALRVIARSAALQLQGTAKSMRVLGEELNVQYVVEGSVHRAADRLRVSAQVARVEDEQLLWAQKFTGHVADLFEIEETIARAIAEALEVRLSARDDQRLAERPIPDIRAYEYFLRAKQQVFTFTGEALDRALEYLQRGRALLGEENAQLTAAMGYVYWQYYNAGIRPDPGYLEKARGCGERLLAGDPDSPDGHRLMGLVTTQLEGDSRAAISHLRRALAASPNDTDSMLWLAVLYGFVGRSSSGYPLAKQLLELDPLTSLHHVLPGVLAMLDGDLDQAVPALRKAHGFDPNNPLATLFYAQALAMGGAGAEAAAAFALLERNQPETFFAGLARVYQAALSGDRERTRQAITADVVEASRSDFQYSWSLAQCLAMVGAAEEAIRWLANATRHGFVNYPLVAERDPLLKPIRESPGFGELIAGIRHQWMAFDR